MNVLTRLALTLPVLAVTAAGAGYCSLTVDVVAPNGQRPIAMVTVIGQNGLKEVQIARGKSVAFCDLGIRPATVKIGGDDTCNQVLVREVPLSWGTTYHLKAVYDPKPCLVDARRPPTPKCTLLVRTADEDGKWVPNASIATQGLGTRETDDYGRALIELGLGDLTARITAPGFRPTTLTYSCDATTALNPQEETVRLKRQ